MGLSVGQVISDYEIVDSLGSGAFGTVYRARDTRLDREVAIKVLPREWGEDPDRRRRIAREAKVLASLNHPHVAQIYGVTELDGADCFLLEFVDGEDLSGRIARGPLPLEDAMDICRQIADGLAAAHDAGIVHRDLKPGNVRLTPGGVAKVLDFGLAKPLRSVDAGDDSELTREGSLIGTPAYMSPEQVRGRPIDRRADVWAFGCVLYECLTGQRPFTGETLPDLISAILDQEPDLDALAAQAPPHLVQLTARCLDKHPRTRLQDVGEARVVLERGPDASEPARRTRGVPAGRSWLTTGVLVAVAALATFFVTRSPTNEDDPWRNPLEGARFTTLTNFEGIEANAAISPDGASIAFISDRNGVLDAWYGAIGSDEFRNLTNGRMKLDTRWAVRGIGFKTDQSVWVSGRPDRNLRVISIATGNARDALSKLAVAASWNPEGTRVVYHERAAGDPVYLAGADGENRIMRRLGAPTDHQHHLAWSPDGAWIYFMGGRPEFGDTHIARMRTEGGAPEQLTTTVREAAHPVVLDDRTVLFVGREPNGSGPWLWALDVPTRETRRVNIGPGGYTALDASRDRRRLVASVGSTRANLWRVPIGNSIATEADVTRHPLEATHAQAPRLRGSKLFYLSSRSGLDGLWVYREGKAHEIWSGAKAPIQSAPAVSKDGTLVAIVVIDRGKRVLRVMDANGNNPRDVSGEIDVLGSAAWSPDGTTLVAGGEFRGVSGLFLFDLHGGTPTRIADGPALDPVWSPRGDLIVYVGKHVTFKAPLRGVNPNTREPTALPEILFMRGGQRVRFLPDGSGLVYMQGLWNTQDFYLLSLDEPRPPRRLTQLDYLGSTLTFDISADGDEIIFDRIEEESDIVLIELD